ncbi:MAG: outer membrane beta-barrel protein, partial [Planctomycetota bacterium]
YSGFDNLEVYAGWTLGWDTGFDQFGGGSSFLGGFSTNLTDDIAFTYIATAGDFGSRSRSGDITVEGDGAYSHSLVFDVALTDSLNYVFQSDLVGIDDQEGAVTANDQVGINQYLFYTLNDCWAAGVRAEWWKSDGESVGAVTYGLNYRPHANLILRPEVRHDFAASDAAAASLGFTDEDDYNQTSFGIDAILTY